MASWVRLWKCFPVRDWIKAADAYCNENYRTAAIYYDRALTKRPDHPASDCARLDLAYCLYRLGEKDRIVSLLTPLIKSKSIVPQAYLLLARVLLQMGKRNIAMSITSKACEVFPEDVEVLAAHIFTHMQGDPEHVESMGPWVSRAKRLLTNASGLTNTSGETSNLDKEDEALLKTVVAWHEHHHADASKAEKLLSEAVVLGAESVELYLLLSDRQIEEKHVGIARDMLCEAMRVDSSDPRPFGALARSYLRDGVFIDPQAAVSFASKACQQSSWINLEYLVILRQAYEACGDSDAAELVSMRLEKLAIAGRMGFETVRFALANLEDLQKSARMLAIRPKELH